MTQTLGSCAQRSPPLVVTGIPAEPGASGALRQQLQGAVCRGPRGPAPRSGPQSPESRGHSVQSHLLPWGWRGVGQAGTQRARSGLEEGIPGGVGRLPSPRASPAEGQLELVTPSGLSRLPHTACIDQSQVKMQEAFRFFVKAGVGVGQGVSRGSGRGERRGRQEEEGLVFHMNSVSPFGLMRVLAACWLGKAGLDTGRWVSGTGVAGGFLERGFSNAFP